MNPLLDLLDAQFERFADRRALCMKERNRWIELRYRDLQRRSAQVASVLAKAGVQNGARVAIFAESRPEWGVALLAALRAGAVAVPLDPKLTESELVPILEDCRPRVLFTSRALVEAAEALRRRVPGIVLFVLEEVTSDAFGLAAPSVGGRAADDTALIVYTSGTTGEPKGVTITLQNLAFQVRRLAQVFGLRPGDRTLSILPLNHLIELTGGLLVALYSGATICYSPSLFPQDLVALMQEKRVSALIGVPLLFTALQRGIEREAANGSSTRRLGFRVAKALARVTPFVRWRRMLFAPIHRRFGGALSMLVSGGAALDPDVARYFDRLGLPIYQGYGLTETSPVIAVNTPRANRLGSVGRPLEGVEIRIADGEILTRGPHVMRGYYGRDGLTREVIDEGGWLRTGDLGRIDGDGFLYVTGRLKRLIVLDGGKKVQPEEVEICLSRASTVKEICILGRRIEQGRLGASERVCAVAVPADPGGEQGAIEAELARLARDLAPFKRPARIYLHPDDLPKTPSRKVRLPDLHRWLDQYDAGAPSGAPSEARRPIAPR